MCQTLYNNNYNAAEAPPVPELKAYEDDGKVVLYWDDRAENGIYYAKNDDGTIKTDANGDPVVDHTNDKLTGTNKFQGYKLYKSDDGGVTWGQAISDMKGIQRGFVPLAIYDKIDAVAGESDARPYFDLGDNTGLKHYFIDQNVRSGYEYLYALLAYDSEDSLGALVIPPIENSIPADPTIPGDNMISIRPRGQAQGTTLGSADSVATLVAGNTDQLTQRVEVLDPGSTKDATYEITFTQSEDQGLLFNVKNTSTGQWARTDNLTKVVNWPFYDEVDDNPPVFDGVKVYITNVDPGIKEFSFTGSTEILVRYSGIYDVYFPDTYELRWNADALNVEGPFGAGPIPFTIYNVTKDAACQHHYWDNDGTGDFSSGDEVLVIEGDGNLTHIYRIYYDDAPVNGDVCTVISNSLVTEADKYQFTTKSLKTNTIKESDLEGIRVVPNPYIFTSPYETGKFGGQKEIQFHYLPPECTIRIFNLASDLLQTIEHTNGAPIESWNLRTVNDQEVSFGIYLYHIEAKGIGEHIGKFAVIK